MLASLLLLLASCSWAANPLPSVSSSTIDSNFADLYRRIRADSIRGGNPVKSNVEFSSSAHIRGNAAFDGSVTLNGPLVGVYNVAFSSGAGSDITGAAADFVCIAGSTTTLTVSVGSRIRVMSTGVAANANEGSNADFTVIEDGVNLAGSLGYFSRVTGDANGANGGSTWAINLITSAQTSGTKSLCLAWGNIGGTPRIKSARWQFIVEEIR